MICRFASALGKEALVQKAPAGAKEKYPNERLVALDPVGLQGPLPAPLALSLDAHRQQAIRFHARSIKLTLLSPTTLPIQAPQIRWENRKPLPVTPV